MEKNEDKKEKFLNEKIAKIEDATEENIVLESNDPSPLDTVEEKVLESNDIKEENNQKDEKEANIEFSFYDDSVNIQKSEPLFGKEDYVDRNTNPILFNNPFLYTASKAAEDNINSVEDFAVKYKKSNVYLGSIVHNDKIEKKSKLKLVKKNFKIWKKNFKNTYIDAIGNVSKSVETMEITPVKTIGGKFKFTLIVFLILEVAFLLMFLNSSLNLIPVEMLIDASSKLTNSFNDNIIYKLVIILPLVLLLGMIVLGIIYKIKSHKFRKLRKKAVKFSTKSAKNIKKDFKKVYPNAYKYYVKNVKETDNEMFEPLSIDRVACNNFDLTEIEELIVDIVNTATVQTKRYKITKLLLRILLTLFSILVLASIVLFVISMF